MLVVSCVSHMLVSVAVTSSWSFRSLINLDLKLVTSNYNVIFLRSLKQESCRWFYEMYHIDCVILVVASLWTPHFWIWDRWRLSEEEDPQIWWRSSHFSFKCGTEVQNLLFLVCLKVSDREKTHKSRRVETVEFCFGRLAGELA